MRSFAQCAYKCLHFFVPYLINLKDYLYVLIDHYLMLYELRSLFFLFLFLIPSFFIFVPNL